MPIFHVKTAQKPNLGNTSPRAHRARTPAKLTQPHRSDLAATTTATSGRPANDYAPPLAQQYLLYLLTKPAVSIRDIFKGWSFLVQRRKAYEALNRPIYGAVHRPLLQGVVSEGVVTETNMNTNMWTPNRNSEYEHVDTDPEAYGPYERDYADDESDDSLEIEEFFIRIPLPRRAG